MVVSFCFVRDEEQERYVRDREKQTKSKVFQSQKNPSLAQSENNTVVIYGGVGVGGVCAKSHMITIRSEAELTLNQLR